MTHAVRGLLAAGIASISAMLWTVPRTVLWVAEPDAPVRPGAAYKAGTGAPVTDDAFEFLAPAVQPSSSAAAPAIAKASPGARVDQLVASGDPRDALLAFQLIDLCVRARVLEVSPNRRPMVASLTETQLPFEPNCQDIGAAQIRMRLALAEAAARAGVPGAVTAWTAEGPFGDKTALTQRPDDPLVIEWVRQAVDLIKAAARRDDVAAITQLGWLAVHWDMSDSDRLSALLQRAAEWEPQTLDRGEGAQALAAAESIRP